MPYRPLTQLTVAMDGVEVGLLELHGQERSPDQWRFTYLRSLEQQKRLSVSMTMPIREAPYEGALVHNWFENLLPEGAYRSSVCGALGIPFEDTFTLLGTLAHECAGSVQILPAPSEGITLPEPDEDDLETILYMADFGAVDRDWAPLGVHYGSTLAGAQDKLSVIKTPGGKLRLRRRHEWTTHILKPEPKAWPGLRDLEAFGQRLAVRAELPAMDCELTNLHGRPAVLIRRYDRVVEGRTTKPVHQEDMCQLLGYPSTIKYEEDGGPSVKRCDVLPLKLGLPKRPPLFNFNLVLWTIYCALLGNADAHGKNVSLIDEPFLGPTLIPWYDLVPTIAYPETLVGRRPAMAIGRAPTIEEINVADWSQFARDTSQQTDTVVRLVEQMGARMLECIPSVLDELESEGANSERLRRHIKPVEANIHRILKNLSAGQA
jgi:serine/threonine-protein kinase HipA